MESNYSKLLGIEFATHKKARGKLHNLQKAEKEMELALQEQKRVNDDLRQELKDQDDLIGKIHNQY